MSILTALLAAAFYGTGDFFGGIATRRTGSAIPVIVVSHVVGLGLVLGLLPIFGGAFTTRAFVAGAAGGLAGAVGFAMLYRGLAVGRMAVVAPITALGAALIPLAWGLAGGERPGLVALSGAVVALVAIPLVAGSADSPSARWGQPGLLEAVGAGVAFAAFFIALDASGDGSGVVPLLAARIASIPLFALAALATHRALIPSRDALPLSLGAGALDMAANGLFLASTRLGFLALSSVLVALYPAVTIILARAMLHERLARVQKVGLAFAGVGVALMAAA